MPINDDKATSLLIGLSLESKKEHIVRAVLESLAFRFRLLYDTMSSETKTALSPLIKYYLLLLWSDYLHLTWKDFCIFWEFAMTQQDTHQEMRYVKSLYFATRLEFNAPDGGVPRDDLRKILHGGHSKNGSVPPWLTTRQTHRQTVLWSAHGRPECDIALLCYPSCV